MSNTVWTFTNKKELDKSQFIDYIERKVFRTIRKHNMLPKDKIIILKESDSLNTVIIKDIIGKKFEVKFGTKPNMSSESLSQFAEDIFNNALKGDFKNHIPNNAPLSGISDKELELYAKLKNIKGTKRKQDEKIQNLFNKFLSKNQDLELNVVKAIGQIN